MLLHQKDMNQIQFTDRQTDGQGDSYKQLPPPPQLCLQGVQLLPAHDTLAQVYAMVQIKMIPSDMIHSEH